MRFHKYHALGNDYIVLNPRDGAIQLDPAQIQLICHRHYGIGSDGILLGPTQSAECDFGLRFFNPDGGEFEKSGNGLRIFSRYLRDEGLVQNSRFTIMTAGGKVTSRVHTGGRTVSVDMGRVNFHSSRIPVTGPPRDVINETITVAGQKLRFCAVTIGNPHCVVLREQTEPEQARMWGPLIENDPRFPNRTNVQFLDVINCSIIKIEIWERGVGYTLASGSSSCAAAAVARRLGLCDSQVTVKMPGGALEITIAEDWSMSMTGPVTKVCSGVIADELLEADPDPSARKEPKHRRAGGRDESR